MEIIPRGLASYQMLSFPERELVTIDPLGYDWIELFLSFVVVPVVVIVVVAAAVAAAVAVVVAIDRGTD